MLSIDIVADFFILKAVEDADSGDVMTHLRLQKLVYYAQAWNLAINGKRLFRNIIEARAHGPIRPDLWNRFKDIEIIGKDELQNNSPNLKKKDRKLLEDVWSSYGQYTAKCLEEIVCSEHPWIDARDGVQVYEKGCKIRTDLMKNFYSDLLG